MAHHAVIEALEEAVEALHQDLHVLAHMVKLDNKSMAVTHDNTKIIVHLPLTYKAYVPKKFKLFEVAVSEWEGDEVLDMDTKITLQKYGIYVS